jgi:hypothetical protein
MQVARRATIQPLMISFSGGSASILKKPLAIAAAELKIVVAASRNEPTEAASRPLAMP